MITLEDYKLDNIDPEDFGDTLLKLEKSFGIKFEYNTFKDAKTFGDICDCIESQINFTNKEDCTTQQAFYKVRNAISLTQNIDKKNIETQTQLETVFPRQNRRQKVKEFKQELGISIDLLSMKTWLVLTIVIGFTSSIIAFFFSWKVAVCGLLFFYILNSILSKFSKEIKVETVGHLAEKITQEYYSQARRHSKTVNRSEIVKTIQDVFIAEHFLEREHLTREAQLGWK
ncbi:hypothetical protein ACFOWM_13170 [Ferruginibacter yonginensis]|uniref:Acyl carrier protein n=1 Tax=Ferruginibacter yonginensis TaxID=1310416 RepID=A0ABV8QU71_9BACT